jgi:hypothetical protein
VDVKLVWTTTCFLVEIFREYVALYGPSKDGSRVAKKP